MKPSRLPPAPPQDRLLSIEEAMDVLGRTRQSLYSLVKRHRIPFRRDGHKLLFVERELYAYIASLEGLTFEEWDTRHGRR